MRSSASATPTTDSNLPRAASLTLATSFASRSAFRNAVTGTASLVSLSIITAMPMPQFGWQPQLNWPHSRFGPCTRSAQSEKVLMKEIGNQSRVGSPRPVWFFTSCARCRACSAAPSRRSSVMASSRPVKRNRLEAEEGDLLRIVERELDDAAHLLVVDAVDDRDHRHDVHAGFVQVLDRPQLHVEQIADLAVRVGRVADAVELQIGIAQAGFGSRAANLLALGELDAVGGRLHGVVADLARVSDGVQEVRATASARRRENCTDICRRGLMVMALSSIVLISSQVSSCTKPTWLASMKQGSHIMLQRLVRSMVSTEPRPCVTVVVPWLCSFSSLWARMSRPGKTSSRCLKNAVSIDITSSKWPCFGQSFTIRILPSRSMICALISPTFSFSRISCGSLPSRICWRISGTHLGQSESVSRGQPSGGFCFC